MSTLTSALPGMASIHPFDALGRIPQALTKSKRMVFHPTTPLPFYLNYIGGNWDGRLIEWKEDYADLRITGFPPIEISQHLYLQFFAQGQEGPWLQCQAVIQELKVETGLSAWEGTTKIILNCRAWGKKFDNLATGIEPRPAQSTGNFLFGQVLQGSQGSSCTFQSPDRHPSTLPLFSSRSVEQNRELNVPQNSPGKIRSSRLTIKKTNEQRIRAYHDRPEEGDQTTLPVVVISPGYGETKRDYLTLAYYFASNGFQVIRYDHTNHVGESDGNHYHVSLSSMKDDLQTVTRFVRATWPHSPVIGVASSLASRVALKAEAECPSLSFLVMLMGIVNVQRSAATVHQEDVFAAYCDGQYPDSANILGFNVGSQFLGDAIAHKFATVEHTLNDAKSLTSPVIVVSAGKDAWVAPEDLQAFRNALGSHVKNWIVVPDALHRLQENPKLARETYRQVVALCHEGVSMSPAPCVIRNPNRLDLGRQNREEKAALQQQAMTEVGKGFWQDYLGHFQSVGKCPDYVKLLDHVFHALGPISPGQRLLDAGCGNGNAGLFFLNTLRSVITSGLPLADPFVQYMGVDVVPEALRRANHAMMSAISGLQQLHPLSHSLVKPTWAQVDLGRPLPFQDNQFDRIVSNLVLGYVPDPRAALSELYRVLAPGGRMVISNLKPDGDFSGIYQSLVSNVAFPQQREEARELLNNYGKIRQAEKEGQFCFFDRMEWESLVTALGCVHAEIHPTFAGQAFLIVLEKPSVSAEVSTPFFQNGRSSRNQGSEAGILKQVA